MDERIFERVILTNEKLDGRFMNEKSIETFLAKFVTVKLEVDWVHCCVGGWGWGGGGKGSESIRSEKIVWKSNTFFFSSNNIYSILERILVWLENRKSKHRVLKYTATCISLLFFFRDFGENWISHRRTWRWEVFPLLCHPRAGVDMNIFSKQ